MNEEELKELLEALGQSTFWINPFEYKKYIIQNVRRINNTVQCLFDRITELENKLQNKE